MGRQVSVVFNLSAKDQASVTIKDAGKNVGGSLIDMASAAYLAKTAFNLVGDAFGAIRDGIEDLIASSLKYQSLNTQQEFFEFGKSIDLVKARLGDAFLPTLEAVMRTVDPLVKSFENWLVANQKLIATGILEWTVKLARALVDGIVTGVTYVTEAITGWQAVFKLAESGFDHLQQIINTGLGKMALAFADVAEKAHQDELAAGLRRVGLEAIRSGNQWLESGVKAATAADNLVTKQDQLEARLQKIQTAASHVLDGVLAAGYVAVGDAAAGANVTVQEGLAKLQLLAQVGKDLERIKLVLNPPKAQGIGELTGDLEVARGKLEDVQTQMQSLQATINTTDPNSPAWQALQAQLGILETKAMGLDREIMKDDQAILQHYQKIEQAMAAFGTSIGQVLGEMAAGAIRAKDATKQLATATVGVLQKVAMDYLVTGMTEAIASNSSTGPWGWIAGIAAASALFAFADSYIQKMATGGFVQGFGYSDSVPVYATPGEYMMTRREVAQGYADWQKPASGSGGMTVVLQSHSLVPDTGPAFMKRAEPLIDLQRQYQRLGLIPTPAARS